MKKGGKKKSSKPVKNSKNTKALKSSNKRPTGLKTISIIECILAVLFLLVALNLFSNPSYLNEFPAELSAFSPISVGISFLLIAIIFAFLGLYLWKMKNWVRIAHLVIYGLLLILGIISLISGSLYSIIDVLIEALIIWYLGFNKNVIKMFK